MSNAITYLQKLLALRPSLTGRKFFDLTNGEKRILYASDLYDDCKDLKIVAESVLGAPSDYVNTQLKVAFMYEDETIIV